MKRKNEVYVLIFLRASVSLWPIDELATETQRHRVKKLFSSMTPDGSKSWNPWKDGNDHSCAPAGRGGRLS
jgi:hypothetical protein